MLYATLLNQKYLLNNIIYNNFKWKFSKHIIIAGVIVMSLAGFFSARVYSKGVLKTFITVPDLAYHYPGMNEIQDYMARLNPEQKYRILDLTQDDDGSWLHTRFLIKDQRSFQQFNLVLDKMILPNVFWLHWNMEPF